MLKWKAANFLKFCLWAEVERCHPDSAVADRVLA